LPPLPAAFTPFAGLAKAGCSAKAGGSGAVAPSAAAGGSAPENWTHRGMWKKAAELCAEKAFDDLGLGTSAGTGNLENSLVESDQRVAAGGSLGIGAQAGVVVVSSGSVVIDSLRGFVDGHILRCRGCLELAFC
jgi:hypothetical protein